jgi:hypothetical protein
MSEQGPPSDPPKSFGNMSEHHWSRARAGSNTEALDYYRSRELAPGVREGGAERNFYCMQCDGVIPFDFTGDACPHCATKLEGQAKRYFNWVEINEAPQGDARAVLMPVALGALVVIALVALVWWWL